MTTGVVMAVSLAVIVAVIGAAKVLAVPASRREAERLGFTVAGYRWIGVAELLAAAGLAASLRWTAPAVAACAGLVVLLAGAVITLHRAGDPPSRMVPAMLLGVAAAATAVVLLEA